MKQYVEPTPEEIEALRKDFSEKRLAAERAAYALFCALPVGRERERDEGWLMDHKSEDSERFPSATPKPMSGTWTLTGPNGRTWQADSPLRCCSLEQRERVPADVALARILAINSAPEDVDAAKVAQCSHRYMHLGTEQPRRRCVDCNELEPAAAQQSAQPVASSVNFLPHDNYLRFVQRVLEGDAPKSDKDDAARMVRDMRRSIYTAAQPVEVQPVAWPRNPDKEVDLLHKLGKRLAELLDEDQFSECEGMLISLEAGPWTLKSAQPVAREPMEQTQIDELIGLASWHGAQACNLPVSQPLPKAQHRRTAEILRAFAHGIKPTSAEGDKS